MKLWLAATLLLVVSPLSWAGSRPRSAKSAAINDPDYVLALGTANRFLHSWQTGDLETGMVLISDKVRHSHNPEALEHLFLSTSDRAYEIGRGQGHQGRYRFPVVLITRSGPSAQRSFSEIVLLNTGKNDWVVDKLP